MSIFDKEGAAEEIASRFEYHPPSNDSVKEAHELVRELCKQLTFQVVGLMPDGSEREQAIVVTKMQEVMHWANSGIAVHQSTSQGGL